jgi:hypothetical protein
VLKIDSNGHAACLRCNMQILHWLLDTITFVTSVGCCVFVAWQIYAMYATHDTNLRVFNAGLILNGGALEHNFLF